MSSDLAQTELLDSLDPLRHLREYETDADQDTAGDSDSAHNTSTLQILPSQPIPLRNQITQLAFTTTASTRHDSQHPAGAMTHVHVLLQSDTRPGCGGIAWPAGEVLGKYLAHRGSNALASKSVIELGSGTGLVGLVAAKLGARVWITDQAPLLSIMHTNVELNNLTKRVTVLEYDWGSPKPDALPLSADLIVAADCVYFEPAFPLLVATLRDLVAGDNPEMLFCYKKRRKADKRFFTLLRKHFDWKQVDDDPDFPIYSREAISLLRLTRRR